MTLAASQNPSEPFRNLSLWVRALQQEPALKDYQLELGIMAKKLSDAHDVFFSLGEMMIIWRSARMLDRHPEYMGAFERAQTAYRAARGEPLPNLPTEDERISNLRINPFLHADDCPSHNGDECLCK